MASEAPQLTRDQQRGVTTVGKRLLMSAAAGSGKTRVLAERCAYLVCDAPGELRCDIDELLVVTFTEAAAAEMRDRIGRALDSKCRQCSDARLEQQRHLLEQAQISTLHSFCAQLLRQYFYLIGLDPAFTVMDEQEAYLLRLEVGRNLLHERYRGPHSVAFRQLLDAHAEGDDERLLQQMFRIHGLCGSLLDPEKWLEDAQARITDAANGDLDASELGKALHDLLHRRIAGMEQRCRAGVRELERFGDFGAYEDRVGEIEQICRMLSDLLDKEGIAAVAEIAQGVEFARLPSVPSGTPNKELAKAVVDDIRDEFKSGSWRKMLKFSTEEWQQGLSLLQPHMQELISLVREFSAEYAHIKEESRQLDFADLERFSLKILLADPQQPAKLDPSAAALQYQRLFKYVLVDEYQDINEVQNAIISLVSRGEKPEIKSLKSEKKASTKSNASNFLPNLFAVGDVKQSIYRFRLADPEQFIRREERLRKEDGSEVIDLKQNFRSREPLLQAINAVFARLMTRSAAEIEYDQTQRLVPGRSFADPDGQPIFPGAPIELHVLADKPVAKADDEAGPSPQLVDEGDAGWDRTEREAAFVARRILQIVGKAEPQQARFVYDRDKPTPRPAKFGDIVILLRSKRYKAADFVRILERFGIPTHAESGSGFFEGTEIRDMVALLCLMDNQQQDMEMAAWLRSPLARMDHVEDAFAMIRAAFPKGEFHHAVTEYAKKDDALGKKLKTRLDRLDEWRQRANREPVHEIIWSIFHETGYLAYVSGLAGGQQRTANLLQLYEYSRSFGTHRRQGLGRFLEYLKALERESDVGAPTLGEQAGNVVQIMTIHAAKGREFPIVFLPDCGKGINFTDERSDILIDRHLGLAMSVVDEAKFVRYPSLAQVVVRERIHRKAIAEEMRVLYVALTRAMEHLILVGTAKSDSETHWREQWSGHTGPLPESQVTSARTMLDWLGPVWAISESAGEGALHLQSHSLDELEEPGKPDEKEQLSPEVKAIRERKPLPSAPPPPMSPDAERIIARLKFEYPFDRQVKEKAATNVTALAKGLKDSPEEIDEREELSPVAAALQEKPLPMPAFFAPAGLVATEIGTATHLALQHLHFGDAADAAAISRQLDAMVADHKLEPEQHACIDIASIEWMMGTEIGRLLCEHEPRLLRELPVYFSSNPIADSAGEAPADKLDETMIRGRLDLVIPTPQGLVVVDYKTDRAPDPATLKAIVEVYQKQIGLYANALQRIIGKPVLQCFLIFLRERKIVQV
jgi:ATP-dependent helicase/nuclease subunit A